MPDLTTPLIDERDPGTGFVYSCFRCGTSIRISEPRSGAKYRCPHCRAKVRFKPRSDAFAGSPLMPEEVRPHPALRIMIVALIVTVIGVSGMAYYGYALNRDKVGEFKRLDQLVNAKITDARRQARSHSFDAVGATIGQAESEVAESALLNIQSRELLQDRLAVASAELKVEEAEFQRKLKAGYHVVGGRLLDPDDAALAIADERQREEIERSRREAEAQARAEAEEKARALHDAEARALEEQERRQREQEKSQSDLADSLRALPEVEDVLGGFEYSLQRMKMTSALLSKRLAEVDANRPFDMGEFALTKEEARRRIGQAEAPMLAAFRDEISDFLASLDFNTYLLSGNEAKSDGVPVQFAHIDDRPVAMIGIAFSDSIYSAVDPLVDAPQKRAEAFAREVILRSLRGKPGPGRMPPGIKHVGIACGYAMRNFARRDEIPEAEFVCLVMPTQDVAAFARGDLSDGDLLRSSVAFVATRDEPFTRIDIPMD